MQLREIVEEAGGKETFIHTLQMILYTFKTCLTEGLCEANRVAYSKGYIAHRQHRAFKELMKLKRPENRTIYDFYWPEHEVSSREAFINLTIKEINNLKF